MDKSGILYKGMAKYRIKFLIINIVLTALFALYTVNTLPYLKTAWTGATPLDMERFYSEVSDITIDKYVELTRKDRATPDGAYLKKTSYWQGDRYLFSIKADEIQKTDVIYQGRVAVSSSEVVTQDMYRLYLAKIGNRNALVLAYANQEVSKDLTGCIVHMQKSVLSGASTITDKNGPMDFIEYVIDVRGLEMEAEDSDHVFFWLYLAGLMFLYIKLIRYFINPLTTPTYKQLLRYGNPTTVAEEINRQAKLPSARRNGKDVVLDEFILSKGFMKLIVTKNHMAKN